MLFFIFQAPGAGEEAACAEPESHQDSNDEEDIESALNKELDSLKAERTKQPSMRRFQVVESGANNCIFIQTTVGILQRHYFETFLKSGGNRRPTASMFSEERVPVHAAILQ